MNKGVIITLVLSAITMVVVIMAIKSKHKKELAAALVTPAPVVVEDDGTVLNADPLDSGFTA